MNKSCLLLIFCAMISACDYKTATDSSNKNILLTISVSKFRQKLNTNKFVLIDVKTKSEHEKEKILGSQLIDFYGNDFVKKLNKLNKKQKYLIYCHGGARSSLTLRFMRELGFKEVYDLKGGIASWKSAGFKVIRND